MQPRTSLSKFAKVRIKGRQKRRSRRLCCKCSRAVLQSAATHSGIYLLKNLSAATLSGTYPLQDLSAAKLKGSIGEGPNHSNFSDRSSVRILGIHRKPRKGTTSVRILGIQRKPRKAPSRKTPLQRSGNRPNIQEGAARKERKGKQTALRERGVRRSRTDS